MNVDQCSEAGRTLLALGAVFFLLGARFMLLRWHEFTIAQARINNAVEDAKRELRDGVSGLRLTIASHAEPERRTETDDSRIVQARSDPPGPLL